MLVLSVNEFIELVGKAKIETKVFWFCKKLVVDDKLECGLISNTLRTDNYEIHYRQRFERFAGSSFSVKLSEPDCVWLTIKQHFTVMRGKRELKEKALIKIVSDNSRICFFDLSVFKQTNIPHAYD